MAGKTAYLIDA